MTPAEQLASAKPRKEPPVKRRPFVCGIRERRQALGLNLRDVARACDMSAAGLSEIERGTDPMLTTAMMLADFFGCEIDDLWQRTRARR